MIYGSVCSGIEAPTVAWHGLGWKPAWFAEVSPNPAKVLKYHYPEVPNLGDMTKINESEEYRKTAIDILVGGTPCQDFSVAGHGKGLGGSRGNLSLQYCRILQDKRPRWFVWENVPGVLSTNGGRDFFAIINAFRECGYSVAYRILDSQYFGVPQRRRRVFVVGYYGADWRPPYAVLFEQESMQRDIGSGRTAREKATSKAGRRLDAGHIRIKEGHAAGEVIAVRAANTSSNGWGINVSGTAYTLDTAGPCAVAFDTTQITSKYNRSSPLPGDPCHPLAAQAHPPAVFLDSQGARAGGIGYSEVASPTLRGTAKAPSVMADAVIRRLTPLECERLQGFPDDYTKILSNTARYAALGNSMTTNVMRWIGERMQLVDQLIRLV